MDDNDDDDGADTRRTENRNLIDLVAHRRPAAPADPPTQPAVYVHARILRSFIESSYGRFTPPDTTQLDGELRLVATCELAIREPPTPFSAVTVLLSHAAGGRCVFVRAVKGKPLELSTLKSVEMQSMAGAGQALPLRSKGQK